MSGECRFPTKLPPAAAADSLRAALLEYREVRLSPDLTRHDQPVAGTVRGCEVRLWMRLRKAPDAAARFSGTLVSSDSGAILAGRFHTSLPTRIFLTLCRCGIAIFGAGGPLFVTWALLRAAAPIEHPVELGVAAVVWVGFAGLLWTLAGRISKPDFRPLETFLMQALPGPERGGGEKWSIGDSNS